MAKLEDVLVSIAIAGGGALIGYAVGNLVSRGNVAVSSIFCVTGAIVFYEQVKG